MNDTPSSPWFLLVLVYIAAPPVLVVAAVILFLQRRKTRALFLVMSALLLFLPLAILMESDGQTALYFWVPTSLVLFALWRRIAARSD